MKKKFANLPISPETREIVNKKRIELIGKRNKSLTLTEVADEIVLKGVNMVE